MGREGGESGWDGEAGMDLSFTRFACVWQNAVRQPEAGEGPSRQRPGRRSEESGRHAKTKERHGARAEGAQVSRWGTSKLCRCRCAIFRRQRTRVLPPPPLKVSTCVKASLSLPVSRCSSDRPQTCGKVQSGSFVPSCGRILQLTLQLFPPL